MGTISAKTVRGKRDEQEDRLLIMPCNDGYILAICDGYNGYRTAENVTTRLIKVIAHIPDTKPLDVESVAKEFLYGLVQMLHLETCQDISGTTLSLVHISELANRVDIVVLGDSPVVVRWGKNSAWVGPEHNVRAHADDCRHVILRGGIIRDGYLFADMYGAGLMLTRALGDAPFSSVLVREPTYFSFPLNRGSSVALMSDGVYDFDIICTKEQLLSLPMKNADTIVLGALRRGSRDNVSAIMWHS